MMIVPRADDSTPAQASTPVDRVRSSADAALGDRFSQALRSRERRCEDDAAAVRRAQRDHGSRDASTRDADARDDTQDDNVGDDAHSPDRQGAYDAALSNNQPAQALAGPGAFAAAMGAAAGNGETAGAAGLTIDTIGSATASAIGARSAADSAAVSALTQQGAEGAQWSMTLPELGGWTMQATTSTTDGRWNLAFTADAAALAAGTSAQRAAAMPDASTLAAQAQVLAQRLQAGGMALDRIDIAPPSSATQDNNDGAFDGRGDEHPAHDTKERARR